MILTQAKYIFLKNKSRFQEQLLCDPGGTRTPNQQSRNLSFYPIELRSQNGAQRYNFKKHLKK